MATQKIRTEAAPYVEKIYHFTVRRDYTVGLSGAPRSEVLHIKYDKPVDEWTAFQDDEGEVGEETELSAKTWREIKKFCRDSMDRRRL